MFVGARLVPVLLLAGVRVFFGVRPHTPRPDFPWSDFPRRGFPWPNPASPGFPASCFRASANRLGSCCDFEGGPGHNNYQVDCGGGIERDVVRREGQLCPGRVCRVEAAVDEAHPPSPIASITVEGALLTPRMEPQHDRYGNA